MANNTSNPPHVTDSQPNVTSHSPQIQDAAAEANEYWAPLLNQICGDASRHLEEYLASKGDLEVGLLASPGKVTVRPIGV
jgi:hypothetical protein